MKKGIFIVIEGIDGSGKSEIVKLLSSYFFSKNYNVLSTREPTDSPIGKEIRAMLRNEKNPESGSGRLMELFIKDREHHLKDEIEPFLKKENSIVVCDRYYYSTIAFQSAQGLDTKLLISKNSRFLKPDIAFVLDVEPETALKRIEYREKEKFEKLDFMKRIRNNFLKMPKLMKDNIKIIDASNPINSVFNQIKDEIESL